MSRRAGGLLTALAAAVTVAGCGGHDAGSGAPSPSPAAVRAGASATPSPAAAPTSPPVNFHGERVGSRYVYVTKQDGPRKAYALRADSVNGVYNGASTGRSNFTNPHVVFYGESGKQLTADAPAGTVVEKDKTVLMTGGVHARSGDGMTLDSDTLRYDDASQTVHGTGNVLVTFPTGETLRGETVDWNLRDGRINVAGAR